MNGAALSCCPSRLCQLCGLELVAVARSWTMLFQALRSQHIIRIGARTPVRTRPWRFASVCSFSYQGSRRDVLDAFSLCQASLSCSLGPHPTGPFFGGIAHPGSLLTAVRCFRDAHWQSSTAVLSRCGVLCRGSKWARNTGRVRIVHSTCSKPMQHAAPAVGMSGLVPPT